MLFNLYFSKKPKTKKPIKNQKPHDANYVYMYVNDNPLHV